jgi:hypothetical protein
MGARGPLKGAKYRKTPGRRKKSGGRVAGVPNKSTAEIKAIAQAHGPAAIAKLEQLMENSLSDEVQHKAAQTLLDRGYGKAVATTQLAGHDGGPLVNADFFRNLSREELEVWIVRLSEVAGKDPPKDGLDGG